MRRGRRRWRLSMRSILGCLVLCPPHLTLRTPIHSHGRRRQLCRTAVLCGLFAPLITHCLVLVRVLVVDGERATPRALALSLRDTMILVLNIIFLVLVLVLEAIAVVLFDIIILVARQRATGTPFRAL